LPEDGLAVIFKSLGSELGRNLPAIQSTCKTFRKTVNEDVYLKLMGRVGQLANESAGRIFAHDRGTLALHIPVLPLLGRKQRAHLVVNCALHANVSGGGGDPFRRLAEGISYAAKGVAHLDKDLQAKVVDGAIKSTGEALFVSVLGELCTQLAHLDETWRNQLADKAMGLREEARRSEAIGAFGAGLADLGREKQQDLLNAAIAISDAVLRGLAIAGLCKGLKSLHADEREILLAKAIQLPMGAGRALAFEHLGTSLQVLSAEQRATLVRGALTLLDQGPFAFEFNAISGLAAGLEHLEPHQIDALVSASTARFRVVGADKAFAALGTNLRHLTEAQQDQLLAAVTHPDNRLNDVGIALAGLAAGLASLGMSARKDRLGDRLVDMALRLPGHDKAQVLAALGANLGSLRQDRHKDLVDAAMGLFEDGRDLSNSSDIRTLSAGLGAGWEHLSPKLRSALVDTISRTQSSESPQKVNHAAATIAGLGAALPYLREPQFEALLDAAARLRQHKGHSHFSFKDVAFLGFAAEAAKAAAGMPSMDITAQRLP